MLGHAVLKRREGKVTLDRRKSVHATESGVDYVMQPAKIRRIKQDISRFRNRGPLNSDLS